MREKRNITEAETSDHEVAPHPDPARHGLEITRGGSERIVPRQCHLQCEPTIPAIQLVLVKTRSEGEQPQVALSISIHVNFSWTVHSMGKKVPKDAAVLESLPEHITNHADVLRILLKQVFVLGILMRSSLNCAAEEKANSTLC